MPELRQKEKTEETVRVEPVRILEKPDMPPQLADRANDIQELERRVMALRNDIGHLASFAGAGAPRPDGQGMRLGTPSYFAGLNRFGPVAPGMVPPAPFAGQGAPMLGHGVPAFGAMGFAPSAGQQAPWGDAVSTRDFSAMPYTTRQPGVNIVDAGEQYIVQVELPNTKKKDLELLGSERTISLTAQVRPDAEAGEGTIILGEVTPTVYRRTIHLPTPCNTQKSRASLKDGVLTLQVPKRDPTNGLRRIDVAYG